MALTPDDVVDQKYRIVRLLGEGGMGAVYEGENTRIHRRVAIKVLHSQVAGSKDAVQRFEREAQAAGRIGSEHIVEVLDLGHLADGDRYMVMEFLEGESLSERIEARGRLQGHHIVGIVLQLLEGLSAAHQAGIIHRDLKPDNIFLVSNRSGQRDFVKILDFGISKFSDVNGEFSMTRTGAVMGTPYYMSPEQAKGNRNVDHRVDLYAVGVILYEALAGEVPFRAETFNELLFKIVLESPVPLTEKVPDMDPALAAIVQKAMAREPKERFQTAAELQQALRDWLASVGPLPEATLGRHTPSGAGMTGPDGTELVRDDRLERTFVPEPGSSDALSASSGAERKATPRQRTQSTWSASGDYGRAAPKAPRRWALLTVAAVGLLSLAGGGVYALSVASEDEAEARARAEQAEQEKTAAAQRAEELRREAEEARAEAERAKAERARLEAEALKIAAERERIEAERLAAEKEKQEREAAEAARAARRHTAPPAPTTAPTQDASPPKAAAPSGGRVIRTDL